MRLFTEHGVGATSCQMIADALGVTKGAIYHQFKTKDEIVIAVAEMELARLEDALEAAEAIDDPMKARQLLLTRVIDHAVEHRRAANTLQFDPVIVRLLSDHEPFQNFIERLYGMLVGDERGPDTQVRLAALSCVVGGTVAHPLVADLDDETLRAQLLDMVRRLIDLPKQSRLRAGRQDIGWYMQCCGMGETLGWMTYSGVFERYPNLHVVMTEGYAGWFAFAMQFYDHHFSQSRLHQFGIDDVMGLAKIDVHPSYYLKRQAHATFMWDPLAIRSRDITGLDCLMWGNDYPHHEGSFPFSAEWIEKQFDGVPANEVDQICRGNAAEIFGIKV
jgi:AcrR family transcriptional regulator